MSPSTTSRQAADKWPWWAYFVAAVWAALALALVITTWPSDHRAVARCENYVSHEQGAGDHGGEAISPPSDCVSPSSAEETNEANRKENHWAEPWVAFGTWALVGGTFLLGFYTFRLWTDTKASADRQAEEFKQQLAVAKELADANLQSADSLKRSERAYILPLLSQISAAGMKPALEAISGSSDPDEMGSIHLKFGFRNAGRTPGVITEIQADLRFRKAPWSTFEGEGHYILNAVLGAGEGTDDLTATLKDVTAKKAAWLLHPSAGDTGEDLIFQGMVTYEDVFREKQTEMFVWMWDRRQRRFVPILYPRIVKKSRVE